jgi:hypothetical protein
MSTFYRGLPAAIHWTLACGVAAITVSAHGAPPDAVPSQLLSDDERAEFCTEMHHAATPEERSAVAARMRDTLAPRAKGQGVSLPSWVLEGRAAGGTDIPGLSCGSGAARARAPVTTPAPAPAPAPVRDVPERKAPPREVVTRDPLPPGLPHQPPVSHEPASSAAPVAEAAAPAVRAPAAPPVEDVAAHPAAPNEIPVAHDSHGIAYVTGGVGQDEVAAFRHLTSGYNMRATFTTRSGESLSGVAVQVAKPDGTVVFNATSDGPYLFARLPQGRYRLTASLDGAQRSRELYVPTRGGVKFTMVWPLLHASSAN